MSSAILSTRGLGICFRRGSRRACLAKALLQSVFRATLDDGDKDLIWALRHVDLDVRPGERVGLCGSNGSGKTTLLRLLSGIYHPDEGQVVREGNAAVLLSLGAGVQSHLSGRENVFVAGALHGLGRDEIGASYSEIQAFAELDDATMDTPVRYYSSGMRTRLGVGIATALAPEILLLDEILSTGDIRFREKSAARLRDLADRARCVVISSHSIRALKSQCDRAIWLHQGRVQASGDAVAVLNEYAAFMGARS